MRLSRLVFLFGFLGCLLLLVGLGKSQNHNLDSFTQVIITFHVTSVLHQELSEEVSGCGHGECMAKRFTIEGYADGQDTGTRTLYLLTCDEYFAVKPAVRMTLDCGSIHANYSYTGRVSSDSISFWPEVKYVSPPLHGSYTILSETEVTKPNK
jgi:hypothetical protein